MCCFHSPVLHKVVRCNLCNVDDSVTCDVQLEIIIMLLIIIIIASEVWNKKNILFQGFVLLSS